MAINAKSAAKSSGLLKRKKMSKMSKYTNTQNPIAETTMTRVNIRPEAPSSATGQMNTAK